MCTATFIKDKQNKIIFTTNRDEKAERPTSPPSIHQIGEQKILFPKDQLAGGTWVAVNQKGIICCMMNGAEGEHEWLGTSAEKSRGQVLLDCFDYLSMNDFLHSGTFELAHPFTLLRIDGKEKDIQSIKWNGKRKWMESFEMSKPHIWSAHTLYPEEQRNARANMFGQWTNHKGDINASSIWELHQSSKANNGLLLEGKDTVNTISTTQLILNDYNCVMRYEEVLTGLKVEEELGF